MGYMRHHTIIVSSFDNNLINEAHKKAENIFPTVSNIYPGLVNGYESFFIPPDGSKEGWPESDTMDIKRKGFIDYLATLRYDDLSTCIKWVEVQFGDDDLETKIINDSEQARREANEHV